jgi:hypothetical protein
VAVCYLPVQTRQAMAAHGRDSAIRERLNCWWKRGEPSSYLGQQDRIGSLSPSKQADLILSKGDPSKTIDEIEKVETASKAWIGDDSVRSIESVIVRLVFVSRPRFAGRRLAELLAVCFWAVLCATQFDLDLTLQNSAKAVQSKAFLSYITKICAPPHILVEHEQGNLRYVLIINPVSVGHVGWPTLTRMGLVAGSATAGLHRRR